MPFEHFYIMFTPPPQPSPPKKYLFFRFGFFVNFGRGWGGVCGLCEWGGGGVVVSEFF